MTQKGRHSKFARELKPHRVPGVCASLFGFLFLFAGIMMMSIGTTAEDSDSDPVKVVGPVCLTAGVVFVLGGFLYQFIAHRIWKKKQEAEAKAERQIVTSTQCLSSPAQHYVIGETQAEDGEYYFEERNEIILGVNGLPDALPTLGVPIEEGEPSGFDNIFPQIVLTSPGSSARSSISDQGNQLPVNFTTECIIEHCDADSDSESLSNSADQEDSLHMKVESTNNNDELIMKYSPSHLNTQHTSDRLSPSPQMARNHTKTELLFMASSELKQDPDIEISSVEDEFTQIIEISQNKDSDDGVKHVFVSQNGWSGGHMQNTYPQETDHEHGDTSVRLKEGSKHHIPEQQTLKSPNGVVLDRRLKKKRIASKILVESPTHCTTIEEHPDEEQGISEV